MIILIITQILDLLWHYKFFFKKIDDWKGFRFL